MYIDAFFGELLPGLFGPFNKTDVSAVKVFVATDVEQFFGTF